ncbi:hypothetical protein [Desulfuromonas sp.]|uniref:hypothetical protein n=1 Tax=Desulfuromonas sp. TaxID=892 RepID=UPI0025C6C196|nr:hypothetical protein [Desulfuromonas sp.]
MGYRHLCFLLILPLLLLGSGCSEGDLERTQARSKLALQGTFITESPDEIRFPVKVLFAIDCSLSMGDEINGQLAGSDPYFLRIEAVRNFINEYNSNENTSFEVMLWNNDVFSRTRTADGHGGFTKDPAEINRVLDGAYNDTMTDYLGTLDAVYGDIARDIRNTDDEENLIRTKYIVVFLSDGMSNVQGGRQPDADIWNGASDIAEMVEESGVGGFNFHTFLLLGMFPPTSEGQQAQSLAEATLEGMADRGNGQFRRFDNAESVDFINIVDMRLTVEYKIKYLLAYNFNVRPGVELVHVDSDGDGLPDEEEVLYGSDPNLADSDGDGLGDYFEVKMSSPGHELDPLVQDSPCDLAPGGVWPDTDDDGLTDCEEYVKGTNRRIVDTDRDGIPDGIEFLTGTNPLEVQYTTDSDFDGSEDWLEVQRHTNVLSNDPKIRERYSYNYDIVDNGLVPIEQGSSMPSYVREYNFHISNIDIMDTAGFEDEEGVVLRPEGDNRLRFYVAEVPEDNPDSPPVFRMAEIVVNMNDEGRNIVLTPADFELMP